MERTFARSKRGIKDSHASRFSVTAKHRQTFLSVGQETPPNDVKLRKNTLTDTQQEEERQEERGQNSALGNAGRMLTR